MSRSCLKRIGYKGTGYSQSMKRRQNRLKVRAAGCKEGRKKTDQVKPFFFAMLGEHSEAVGRLSEMFANNCLVI